MYRIITEVIYIHKVRVFSLIVCFLCWLAGNSIEEQEKSCINRLLFFSSLLFIFGQSGFQRQRCPRVGWQLCRESLPPNGHSLALLLKVCRFCIALQLSKYKMCENKVISSNCYNLFSFVLRAGVYIVLTSLSSPSSLGTCDVWLHGGFSCSLTEQATILDLQPCLPVALLPSMSGNQGNVRTALNPRVCTVWLRVLQKSLLSRGLRKLSNRIYFRLQPNPAITSPSTPRGLVAAQRALGSSVHR